MFIDDVCARFEDWHHVDVVAEFKNLQQKDNTGDYHDKFEQLKALMLGKIGTYLKNISYPASSLDLRKNPN